MTKKLTTYALIAFGLAVLWASTSRTAMKWLTDNRDNETWWGMYPCVHGDLVSLSYLDFVPQFNPRGYQRRPHFRRATATPGKKVNLVLCGDSQTWHLDDSNFARTARLCFINRANGGAYTLDTAMDNIMIIEIAERYLRSYFSDSRMLREVTAKQAYQASASWPSAPRQGKVTAFAPLTADAFFNPNINQNIQCNLFNYNFIMPVFEIKAALNYYVFNRASGDVVISENRKYLLLKETIVPEGTASSYSPVDSQEVANIVASLNKIYDHYRQAGFREVYFTVVPNTTTMVNPGGYNHLIPMVEQHPGLRIKVIDVYDVFRQSDGWFYTGDTHWNPRGKQRWLDLVNDKLMQL